MRLAPLLIVATMVPCFGQKLHVYSPLTRVDPSGQIVKADRGKNPPRHILSPGVPRNAYSSLRIVVELDKPGPYVLDIGQNPIDAVKATLYKESFVETADGWIPDSLQKVSIPYKGFPTDLRLPNQRVVTFWLDMWVDRNAEIDRVKVEPQLWLDSLEDWIIYPMEVRIQWPVAPSLKVNYTSKLPPLTEPADAVVRGPVKAAVCGAAQEPNSQAPQQLTARDLMRRNVMQHMAMLQDNAKLRALLSKATGVPDAQWCAAPSTPAMGPEWYLRFRDRIFYEAGARD